MIAEMIFLDYYRTFLLSLLSRGFAFFTPNTNGRKKVFVLVVINLLFFNILLNIYCKPELFMAIHPTAA